MEEQQNNNYKQRPRHEKQATDPLGKLPPHDSELEANLLGELMLEKDAYMLVCDLITADSFYEPRHQKIFSAISTLSYAQKPIDLLTVTEQLREDGTLDEVGGAIYITELTSRVYSAAHAEYHARIVSQQHLARQLISMATMVENKAFDPSNDVDDLLQDAEAELFKISQTKMRREAIQIDPLITEAIEQIQRAANSHSGLSGLQTGFVELDKITSGWQNSDLIIIAARPAMGKTAFVLSMAKTMAVDYSIPTAIFTLEMSGVQLMNRLLSNAAEIPGEKIKSGNLERREWDRLLGESKPLFGAPLYVDENPGLSITDLRTKARRLVREHDVKIIMIDYLQLMTASGMKFGSREQEVSTISRNLKALAKELNIPIIALSQLNRSTESREDKRPVLSDLRESGAIEQDADIVCFIHRPEYYTRSTEDKDGNNIEGLAELIIAKHRSGAVGDVKMRFVKQYARFQNWDTNVRELMDQMEASAPQRTRIGSKMNQDAPEKSPFLSVPQADEPMPDIMPSPGEAQTPF